MKPGKLQGLTNQTFSFLLFLAIPTAATAQSRPNIIFVLSDDHRYDFMGFMEEGPAFLETPNLDRMAREGAHLQNAFVTTSLCSPSRASLLTGKYMHHHRVVDNQRPVPAATEFFPQYLREGGYETAFVGKWHMGHEHDEPRPGFDHWVSFPGQGTYFDPVLNINGERESFRGYTTDILTDRAIGWLKNRHGKPFFLYLSYKAVHYPFLPAPRHKGRYSNARIDYPDTMADTEENYRTQPRWVRDRRYSYHGIDHMETTPFDHDPLRDFDAFYRQYCETVYGLDENLGRVLTFLDESGLAGSTIVLYMGDNGFALGEHGFYDKRDAFEESIRVPMLAWAPGRIAPATTVSKMVLNIDMAPTILDLAGLKPPPRANMDGRSFLPLLQARNVPWRDHMIYEYYWEWNHPSTPTTFALRTDRYKYIYYHGIWDLDGLYDLHSDPHERYNLIYIPAFREQASRMREQLFDRLEASGALEMPIPRPTGERLDDRKLPH